MTAGGPRRRVFSAGRLATSMGVAARGIADLVADEPNVRLHLAAAALAIAAAAGLGLTPAEWCWIALAIGFVLTAEAFNTAIEHLTDLVSPEIHPLAGRAKDVAAGAVLLAAVSAAVIGLLVLGPPLWRIIAS
jgi:diacylglycerol kinase